MFNNITDVVKNLLILNILMFVAGFVIDTDVLALRYPTSPEFKPVQIVTHFFMHAGLAHIFFNMFALITFGSVLESLWGARRFLYFYFFCAFGAAILHMLYSYYDISQMQQAIGAFQANPGMNTYWAFFNEVPLKQLDPQYAKAVNDLGSMLTPQADAATIQTATTAMQSYLDAKINTPIVGASGAIYGLLLAFGMSFPNAELMLIFFPVPVKAKYFIPVLMIIELFLGVNQFSWDNIAHFAHLGGALSGLLLILYWRKFGSRFDNTRYK
ncbi:MAG: rhomboid family intramembrane serine protease [Saprospiraceae bacterium]|nr:rhomboid family intramembrane serine protease [Saprospiraceae bacterium]